jgi:hypothetical protein
MADIEKYAKNFELKKLTITMFLSALGFLVALIWRDAINATIQLYLPVGQSLWYTYLAALIVTIAAAFVTYILIKVREADIVPDQYEHAFADKTVGKAARLVKHGSPLQVRKKLGLKKQYHKRIDN